MKVDTNFFLFVLSDKQIEPIIVQDDRKKHVKIDDNQLGNYYNNFLY